MKKHKYLEFQQNGTTIYLLLLTAKEILTYFDISRRIENTDAGYQRIFSKTRVNSIKNYIEKENGLIPNNILVNLDKDKYSFDDNQITFNTTNESKVGLIIDGQHRVLGADKCKKDYIYPVIAMKELDIKNQARLFIDINKTQKGLPASLIYDLFEITNQNNNELMALEDISPEGRAVQVARQLNSIEPLLGYINMTGEGKKGISLAEFISNTKTYFNFENGKLMQFTYEEQCKIFNIYFSAIKNVFFNQWDDSNTVIFTTTVFGALLLAFGEIFDLTIQYKNGNFNTNSLTELLNTIADFNFKENRGAGGIKAQQNLKNKIISLLKTQLKEEEGSGITLGD